MRSRLTCLFAGLLLSVFGGANYTRADVVQFTQFFPSGFDVSINGGALGPSGPLTLVAVVDDATADIDLGFNGEFPLLGLTLSGAGYSGIPVINPMSLLVWGTDRFAFQRLGEYNQGITGWNGSTSAGSFITNVGDLTTLFGLPYTTNGTSTFWWPGGSSNDWTLGNGDTIGGTLGSGGPDGTFSIAFSAIPEPSSFALVLFGIASAFCIRRRSR